MLEDTRFIDLVRLSDTAKEPATDKGRRESMSGDGDRTQASEFVAAITPRTTGFVRGPIDDLKTCS